MKTNQFKTNLSRALGNYLKNSKYISMDYFNNDKIELTPEQEEEFGNGKGNDTPEEESK